MGEYTIGVEPGFSQACKADNITCFLFPISKFDSSCVPQERMDKMKNIVTEALNSAGSDIDKKLSIVSVQSLIPRPSHE